MANTYLSRTTGTPDNRDKFTISAWVKLSSHASKNPIVAFYGSNDYCSLLYNDERIQFIVYDGSNISNISVTSRHRDFSAWYHIVLAVDTTQGTDTNRVKIYVNGVQETTLTNTSYPSQNADMIRSTMTTTAVGLSLDQFATGFYYDGSMSHVHLIDGTAYDATAFGQYDANGVWTIKTSPSVTYGTNGFFILKDGNSVTDQSGEGNDFTVGGGTLTNTEDSPSNVFATLNPLIPQGLVYANGNLSPTHNASSWKTAYGTIAMSGTGKYYFESKVSTLGSYQGVGIVDAEQISSSAQMFADNSRGYAYKSTGQLENNNSEPATFSSYTTGDIIMTAVDLNAGAIWYGKNGTWQNSATQSEIEAGTTTNACFTGVSNSYVYLPAVAIYGSGTNQCNFGNGYFGTTAVASAGTNASGIGIFEYDVPTGYTALSTKGLNL